MRRSGRFFFEDVGTPQMNMNGKCDRSVQSLRSRKFFPPCPLHSMLVFYRVIPGYIFEISHPYLNTSIKPSLFISKVSARHYSALVLTQFRGPASGRGTKRPDQNIAPFVPRRGGRRDVIFVGHLAWESAVVNPPRSRPSEKSLHVAEDKRAPVVRRSACMKLKMPAFFGSQGYERWKGHNGASWGGGEWSANRGRPVGLCSPPLTASTRTRTVMNWNWYSGRNQGSTIV